MNKKLLYSIIAVVIVIILVAAVLVVVTKPSTTTTTTTASISVTVSSPIASVGEKITFYAFITGGTPSKVIFNFGDGTTGIATLLTGDEYVINHAYNSPGKYLIIANATVNGRYINNMNSIYQLTITPSNVSPLIASEITSSSIITSKQIYSVNTTVNLTGTTLEPPTATNWTIGYYIWSFGDGVSHIDPALLNTSSGNFMPDYISHIYNTPGIYTVTLGVITFNATNYVPSNYTLNGNVYTYYPLSDLASILRGNQYYNSTYMSTLLVTAVGQTANIINTTVTSTNPGVITVIEIAPGGPITLDPASEYYTASYEIVQNVYEFLIAYNGSSTTQFLPVVAKQVPTKANGLESLDGLNYTFYIRPGLKFSNGDPVTAWDVYTSAVRQLLFVQGVPGTGDWIIAQDLLPNGGFAPSYFNATAIYDNITRAVTVNNATQSVTFHLLGPDPAFLTYIADDLPIEDYNWIAAHGAAITFTPQGFLSYEKYGNMVNYNTYLQYNEMGSGPYMIKEYLVGQEVLLTPNPNFVPIPGVIGLNKPVNNTIEIIYEKDPSTAYLYASNGLADIISGLPSYYALQMEKLSAEGKIRIATFPTTEIWFFNFNFVVNQTMLSSLGSGYTIPQYYFSNPDVRRAFADSYNYTEYVNDILGNQKYGIDFGFNYAGVIPKGMPGYVPPSNLSNVPTYNLTLAKQYMEASGYYNTSVVFPIVVLAGDPIDFAAVGMWAANLAQMDPNIHAEPMYLPTSTVAGYLVPGMNPMPIYYWGYAPDYMYPSDYVNPMLKLGGFYPVGNQWNSTLMIDAGYPEEAQQFNEMQNLINAAESTANETLALQEFDQAEQISINLTLLVYNYQVNMITYFSPYIHGISFENSPLLGGAQQLKYYYLIKY